MKAKLFLALFVLFALSSCVTQRKCLQKFPPVTTTEIKTVYRDTTIFVPVPKTDTVIKRESVRDTIRVNSGTAHAIVYTIRDTTEVILWQTDTTLQVRLDSVIRERDILKKEVQVIRERFIPEWIKTLAIVGGMVAAVFLFWFFRKFIKR